MKRAGLRERGGVSTGRETKHMKTRRFLACARIAFSQWPEAAKVASDPVNHRMAVRSSTPVAELSKRFVATLSATDSDGSPTIETS
jgi:hypothetical protein